MASNITVFQGGVDGIGIGGDGIGEVAIEDNPESIFFINFINMHQGQEPVLVLSVDVQDAGFDLDGVAGEAAEAVGPDSRAGFGGDGAVTDIS